MKMHSEQHYLLMLDKKGWKSLVRKRVGISSDYLKIRSDLPEVDVPKGTLVRVDPDCQVKPSGLNYSLTVVCIDLFDGQENTFENVKLSVLAKELLPLETDVYRLLRPSQPPHRYRIMTDDVKYPVIGAQIGDTVYVTKTNGRDRSVGLIRYIGPVDGLDEDSFWFGIELLDGSHGTSDGTLGQRRYFEAAPFSAIFTSAEMLTPYDEQNDLNQIEDRINLMSKKIPKTTTNRPDNVSRTSSSQNHQLQQQQQKKQQQQKQQQLEQQHQQIIKQFESNRLKNRMEEYMLVQNNQKQSVDIANGNLIENSRNDFRFDDSRSQTLDRDRNRNRDQSRVNESQNKKYDPATNVQKLLHGKSTPSSRPNYGSLDNRKRNPPENLERNKISLDSMLDTRIPGSNPALNINDRVVWLTDKHGPQRGTVRWIGILPHLENGDRDRKQKQVQKHWMAGIEFDYPVGNGTGVYQSKRLFTTKQNHAAVLQLDVLIKDEDFNTESPRVTTNGDNFEEFVESYPKSPSTASRLFSESPKRQDRARGNELDPKKMSPLSQFKKTRQLHQQQIEEQQKKNRFSQPQPRNGQESDENGTSLSSNEVNWSSSNSSTASPSTGQRKNEEQKPKVPPKKSSPELRKIETLNRCQNLGNSGNFRPGLHERDPYASEQFIVAAEVHPQSSSPLHGRHSPRLVDLSDNEDSDREPIQVLPDFDRFQPEDIRRNNNVELGTLVELRIHGEPLYGVVKWMGSLPPPDHQSKMAGIEMEEELLGTTNGWHNGSQLFSCPEGKGVFVPYTHFRLDQRFEHGMSSSSLAPPDLNTQFGNMDCPTVPGAHAPIPSDEMILLCGRNKGIQGHQNSCYLDATLFAMFSFTSVFDCLLFRPPTHEDIQEYREVQRVLREEIVNPLRKNYFVRADRVMKLRTLLDSLTSVRGLTSEEKDPEEFLNSLLSQTLRASPFLELSSGQTSHLYQLFVERDESKTMPSVQDLFEQSFLTSGIKLRKVPSVMILQMPRFGKQFKVYNRILPSLILDVTDIIDDSPRQCIVCGKLATFECAECFGEHATGLDSTSFCEACLTTQHRHQKRQRHKWNQLKVPEEFLAQRLGNSDCESRRLFMELFAVVCIETSHYVTFVKSGLGPDAPWCFFDSMADRKGEQHGYNIPEVTNVPHLSNWLTEEGISFLNGCKDDKLLPEQAKRLICDGYMCFYQSPDVMMYQ